ncbi:MAG: ChbG/HpnK family deacetylase [Chloroflexi bacterium]|nr:ChbG/HpnK family deacetylase [Chloroflexota bacterium]
MRRLIVSADDFGLSPGVNRGVIEAHARGSLTSASLLVNLPASTEALELVRLHPSLDLGLHLNLTLGRPLSPLDEVSTLVDARGCFRSPSRLLVGLLLRRISLDEIERELSRQIAYCRGAGLRLTHLDSHLHFHALAPLRGLVARLARAEGISAWRTPDLGRVQLPRLVPLFRWKAARSRSAEAEEPASTDYLTLLWTRRGFGPPLRILERTLAELEGTIELVVHPGHADEELRRIDRYVEARERELQLLMDLAFIELTRRLGCQRSGFADLTRPAFDQD